MVGNTPRGSEEGDLEERNVLPMWKALFILPEPETKVLLSAMLPAISY